jgi:hypothetical protein
VYRSLHECEWNIVEPILPEEEPVSETLYDMSNTTAPTYVLQILTNPALVAMLEQPGKKWLIPGNARTVTHDSIATILLSRKWNGLKLNGKEKSLTIHVGDLPPIDYTEYNKDHEEPNKVLTKLYQQYPQLEAHPFFVTGLNCIKEGITFQGPEFLFDGAILPNIADPSDAYQLACRLAGNIKGFPRYMDQAIPVIVTSARMERIIKKQENIAIHLPRILYEEGRATPMASDKARASRGAVPHDPKGMGYRVFKEYDTYIRYVSMLGRRTTFTKEADDDGLHTCSIQTSRGAKKMPRYLTEAIDKIDLAYGGNGALKTGFPCYLDVEKAPEGLVWVAVVPNIYDINRLVRGADAACPDESSHCLSLAKDYPRV